jgi:hypothetical protein
MVGAGKGIMLAECVVWSGVRAIAALTVVITAGRTPLAFAPATRVDVSPGDAAADAASGQPVISADGRYVAFVSLASNLVAEDTDDSYDFSASIVSPASWCVWTRHHASFGDCPFPAAISQDGRWAAGTNAPATRLPYPQRPRRVSAGNNSTTPSNRRRFPCPSNDVNQGQALLRSPESCC